MIFTEGASYISHDRGTTWEAPLSQAFPKYASNRRNVLLLFNKTEVHKSVDAGRTWVQMSEPGPFKDAISWEVINDSVIYVTALGGTYRTVTSDTKMSVDASSSSSGLQVYPNPATSSLTSDGELLWFDLLGRSYSPPSEMIGDSYRYDVRGLNAGTYIVRQGENLQIVIVQR
jgi:hypothetical protein